MSKIKRFFSKKKEEAAFKLKLGGALGQGHTLNAQKTEPCTSGNKSGHGSYIPPKRRELSEEARVAAAAAVARIDKKDSKEFNTSLAAIKAQAKKELEEEKKLKAEILSSDHDNERCTINSNFACQGVFFRCPIISDEILTKQDWKIKIKEFLYQQLEVEKALTSCLIILNCNSKEKAEECIKTLNRYLENIIKYPEEEKYYKIRMSNRIFCEKVRYVEGALDFLYAAGFRQIQLDDELFLLWSKECVEKEYDLAALIESLQNAETIPLTLDRNIRILLPSQAKYVTLPDDFYRISPDEIKRELKLKAEAAENAQTLKTKAMREREEQKILRMYRYTLIRIKFPNGIYIQGTFNVYEKIRDVFEFVQTCLQDETLEFILVASSGGKFTEEDMEKSLYDLRLVPNIVLLFNLCNENVTLGHDVNFIKEELLLLVHSV